MRVPEFAAQKYLAGAKGHVKELEKMIKAGATSPLFQSALENHKKFLDEMRRDMAGIEEKSWFDFTDVVKAAGLMRDYEAHYSTMSKAVHNTPTGLAAKTDDRILIRSVLNLLNDAVETCAALVFFQIPGESRPRPLTTRWKELAARIPTFQDEYGNLFKRLNNLTNETFRHPEV
jgi:DNA-binding ferritin-like protein (Dps family)